MASTQQYSKQLEQHDIALGISNFRKEGLLESVLPFISLEILLQHCGTKLEKARTVIKLSCLIKEIGERIDLPQSKKHE